MNCVLLWLFSVIPELQKMQKIELIKFAKNVKKLLTIVICFGIISELDVRTAGTHELRV